MDSIVTKIANINALNLVSVIRNEDKEIFHVLKLKKQKAKIDIVSANSFLNFESLLQELDPKIPLVLLIDGKGVLTKRIDLKNETDTEWLKNLDYSTIHFLRYTNLEHQFLSFCRKNIADDVIQRLLKKKYAVLDFYIGPLVSVLLIRILKTSKLFSNELLLSFENEELIEFEKTTKATDTKYYEIEGKSVSSNHLPLYSAAINFFINHKSIDKSKSNYIDTQEFFYKKAFDKLGLAIIIGFFVMLLTSYVLIQYFNSKNTELNLQNVYLNQSFEFYKKLEEQKEHKLKIVNETGIISSKYLSYYNFEIANSVPNEINLTAIDIYPFTKEIKSKERVEFDSKSIIIKGMTINESDLNFWLEKIRTFKWIKKLEIISIKKDKNSISSFELKISVKDV